MPTTPQLPDLHCAAAAVDAVDINDAIVRFVASYQPCSFTELADFFVELPPSGPTNAAHLAALRRRLAGLVAGGRLAPTAPMRIGARAYGPRRARYRLACASAIAPVVPSVSPPVAPSVTPSVNPPQRS